jgi:3-deoxy-7-phosphoheptulonate synthase
MDCVHQIKEGNRSIAGLMLESNLHAGNQSIPDDLSKLRYGVSVTDAAFAIATPMSPPPTTRGNSRASAS